VNEVQLVLLSFRDRASCCKIPFFLILTCDQLVTNVWKISWSKANK